MCLCVSAKTTVSAATIKFFLFCHFIFILYQQFVVWFVRFLRTSFALLVYTTHCVMGDGWCYDDIYRI